MKETYSVKLPRNIVFGDPMYFEQFKGAKLRELTVNFSPPPRFKARVVLEETPIEKLPGYFNRTLMLCMAPEKTMPVYLQDKMFEAQDLSAKNLGVDSARYYLRIGDRDETFHTGGDGHWGSYEEMSRIVNGRRYLDASILHVFMPENESLESMREWLNYFFEDVQQVENAPETEEPSEEEQSFEEPKNQGMNLSQ